MAKGMLGRGAHVSRDVPSTTMSNSAVLKKRTTFSVTAETKMKANALMKTGEAPNIDTLISKALDTVIDGLPESQRRSYDEILRKLIELADL